MRELTEGWRRLEPVTVGARTVTLGAQDGAVLRGRSKAGVGVFGHVWFVY